MVIVGAKTFMFKKSIINGAKMTIKKSSDLRGHLKMIFIGAIEHPLHKGLKKFIRCCAKLEQPISLWAY